MRPDGSGRGSQSRAFGPKMLALIPRHREFVQEYVKLGNATQAARNTGYKDNGGHGIRVMASRLLDRKDIADAVVEETKRRLATNLPINLGLVQKIAEGKMRKGGSHITPGVQLKALELVLQHGGLEPRLQVEHSGQVEVTVRGRWEKIARMAAARGEDPQTVLRNLPEAERLAITQAIALEDSGATVDAEFEELEETAP